MPEDSGATDDLASLPDPVLDDSPSSDALDPVAPLTAPDEPLDVEAAPPRENAVPQSRVDEMAKKHAEQTARLEADLAAARAALTSSPAVPTPPAQPAAPPPQEYTYEQLRAYVDNGQITEGQLHEQLALQTREQAKRDARAEHEALLANQRAQEEHARYRAVAPGWEQAGTDNNRKVWEALAELQRINPTLNVQHPGAIATALRMAFGPATAPAAAPSAFNPRQAARDPHQEITNGGGYASASRDPLSGLDADEKRAYADGIKAGIWPNWKAVREEVRWARSQEAQTLNPNLANTFR